MASVSAATMFTVTVEGGFSATHRLRLSDGTVEPHHGHDWRVRVCFQSESLDDLGMVVDFARAEEALKSVLTPLHHRDLNSLEPFAGLNPTAEVVARHIFVQLERMQPVRPRRVEVTEAPGCAATYGA